MAEEVSFERRTRARASPARPAFFFFRPGHTNSPRTAQRLLEPHDNTAVAHEANAVSILRGPVETSD
jgi:hypothetical protein